MDRFIGMSTPVDSKNLDKVKPEKMHDSATKELSKKIVWTYLIYLGFFHLGSIVALSSYIFGLHSVPVNKLTVLWTFFYMYLASLGVTAGAHRLWTHRCYKAKRPLRILLMVLYSATGLYSLRVWIKDHRQHHKFTDTDLDPHNSKRGLFYSHYGWLFLKRTPECIRTGKEIYMDDVRADPIVMFQDKYWLRLVMIFCFLIPSAVPMIFWGESVLHTVLLVCFLRYIYQLNATLSINSLAHYWGYRPYDRSISAVDNPLVSVLASGEGTHNYHHTFPQDYKATEFPYMNFNLTALFIRSMVILRLAYDLKEPSPELLEKVKKRNAYENVKLNG